MKCQPDNIVITLSVWSLVYLSVSIHQTQYIMEIFKITKESAKFELVGLIDIEDVMPLIKESKSIPGSMICFSGGYKPLHLLLDTMNRCLPEGTGEFYLSHGNGYSWIHNHYNTKWEIDGGFMGIYVQTKDEEWSVE